MLAKTLISENIPPLKITDSGTRAIDWMYEFKTTHLPIVDNRHFLGLITEDDILDFNNPDEPLNVLHKQLYRPIVKANDHIYEVMRIASQIKSPLIPVVDEEENYLGIITMESLLQYFAKVSGMQDEGGIIVLQLKGLKDYVLSDIARIIESNNVYILSSFMHSSEPNKVSLTIKLSTSDIQRIVSNLERYDYEVVAFFQEEDLNDIYQERYDSLMNYLNI